MIWDTGGRTVVENGETCASACVLVFAAGLSRVAGARLGPPDPLALKYDLRLPGVADDLLGH
jgi:hypothetical protein